MAKNTMSSAFRKIDVDQFNEDNFKEDDKEEKEEPATLRGPDESEVQPLLNQYPFQIYHISLTNIFFLTSTIII